MQACLQFLTNKLPNGYAVRLVILICVANMWIATAIHNRNEIPTI